MAGEMDEVGVMSNKVKVSHRYWWDNDVYYRQSTTGGRVEFWNGNNWRSLTLAACA